MEEAINYQRKREEARVYITYGKILDMRDRFLGYHITKDEYDMICGALDELKKVWKYSVIINK